MKENVGRTDQLWRAVAGPALMMTGYMWLGGRKGRAAGIASMSWGAPSPRQQLPKPARSTSC